MESDLPCDWHVALAFLGQTGDSRLCLTSEEAAAGGFPICKVPAARRTRKLWSRSYTTFELTSLQWLLESVYVTLLCHPAKAAPGLTPLSLLQDMLSVAE